MQKAIIQSSKTVCLNDKKVRRADCQHCSLRHGMLFSPLDISALSKWLWPITHKISKAKTRIYNQDQPPQNIFSLRQGYIKLISYSKNGEQRIIRILGPGSCIGLEALLDQSYHQTAEAITEIDYCIIPVNVIFQIEQEQPHIYIELQKQWQKQLNDADRWLNELVTGSIKQRLCRFLIMLHQLQQHSDDHITLISNQNIASILATSEETVSRCLSDLRKNNDLKKVEKRTYWLNLETISTIADN
jgi:CRP-like cAMP-binding protein